MSSTYSRPCPICGSRTEEGRFWAREMMLGTRDPFEYVECGDCGSLHIAAIPPDQARYYDGAYYSYAPPFRHALPKRLVKRAMGGLVLWLGGPAAWLVDRTVGVPAPLHWMRMAGAGFGARILDVGSGSGQHLVSLAELGFRSLLGVDPYIPTSIEPAPGVRVLKASLEEVEGTFEVIMFHHSLEHLPDPAAALGAARRRLAPGGCVLVRVPTVGASWRQYGSDWVELDAPRHLQVPSREGMHVLAERSGLRVRRTESDTTAFEFWASEQYQRDIPLTDPRSHQVAPGGALTPGELQDFENRAAALNRSGDAGRAAFWMSPVDEDHDEGRPTVTAIITNYNYAEYLGRAIDSVLGQVYPGTIEVMVVDDGSTDRSDQVLARYGDRIRILRQANRGQLLAMREGLAASTGEVVCFLDADDAWTPDKVARVVAALEREGAAWLAHGLGMCDADLQPLGVDVAPAGRPGRVPPEPLLFLERQVGTATSGLAVRADAARLLVEEIDRLARDHAKNLRYDADRALIALLGRARLPGFQLRDALALYRRHDRQQFAGSDATIALLERQIAVDRMVGEILAPVWGRERVPTPVYKHELVVGTLRRQGGRGRLLLTGLVAAGRLAFRSPGLAARQALAMAFAGLAPRLWLRRLARNAMSSGLPVRS